MPSVLLFDFGGTLDADGVPWKERLFRLFREEGRVSPEGFDESFYAADDALEGAVPTDQPLTPTVQRLVRAVSDRLGLDDHSIAARVAGQFLAEARTSLARSAAILARLAPRFRLGVVSNFYGNLGAVLNEAGLMPWLSAAIDSTAVGAKKPDPRIFQAALAALGARPQDALFVGDSLPRDMAGARAVGMPHVWLAPPSHNGANPCCPGDPVISSLADLPELLG